MRIAQVAPLAEPVPPGGYGGTERVIAHLTEELVGRGHEVTLFASGDSRTAARLVPVVARALWRSGQSRADPSVFAAIAWSKVCRQMEHFDIVHNHTDHFGYLVARARGSSPPTVVTTLHGRLDLPELRPLFSEFADMPLVSISDAQRRPVPRANWVATIHHGIRLERYAFERRPGDYLAFLGRVSPEKGLDTAIRVARRAGLPLRVVARLPLPLGHDPNTHTDRDYYERVVKPLLDGDGVEFMGELSGRAKARFLRQAAALLFPIHWPEPFGLVMAEALACGTPVIALRHGSVPEVIEHGVTGLVCRDEDQLVEAVHHIGQIDRAACRAAAERRFSAAAMAEQYERVYQQLTPGDGSTRDRPTDARARPRRAIARPASGPRSRQSPDDRLRGEYVR